MGYRRQAASFVNKDELDGKGMGAGVNIVGSNEMRGGLETGRWRKDKCLGGGERLWEREGKRDLRGCVVRISLNQ